LGSDFLKGNISYTIENIGIFLNSGWHGPIYTTVPKPGVPSSSIPDAAPGLPFGDPSSPSSTPSKQTPKPGPTPVIIPANVPNAILEEEGNNLLSHVGGTLTYDTRGGGQLPIKGQKTELDGQFFGGPLGGDREFYRLELRTAWYFPGLAKGHVLELVGHAGVAEGVQGGYVPFYEAYYLGGLYTLRGFKYRNVSPRQPGFSEPIGGDTYWFGSAEYSVPIFEQESETGKGIGVRFAVFYDVGNVESDPYDFSASGYSDDYGFGLRLNLPIGPLRLDYGIPIHHDQYNSSSGRFQFGVGYRREF
jgi:outer membrane protein insertion porin family